MRSALLLCLSLVCSTYSLDTNLITKPLLLAFPVSLTIQSANGFTRGFFSLFRRRREQQTPQPNFLEFPSAPTGPVSYAVPSQAFPYPYQFGLGAENNFLPPQYWRFPGFDNIQGTFSPSRVLNTDMTPTQEESLELARAGRMDDTPSMSHEDAESFFTLLAETDEHQCISRLVCEMGASPETSGEFAQSVNEVFSTLQHFPPGSKVTHYNDILQLGRKLGLAACASRFQICDEESYNIVKNVQMSEEQ